MRDPPRFREQRCSVTEGSVDEAIAHCPLDEAAAAALGGEFHVTLLTCDQCSAEIGDDIDVKESVGFAYDGYALEAAASQSTAVQRTRAVRPLARFCNDVDVGIRARQ